MDIISPDTSIPLMKAAQARAAGAADIANTKRIDESAEQFEAVFISEMIKPMFQGLSTDGMFGGGKGEEIFRGMMIQEYGRKLAQTHSFGLSNQVREHLIQVQAATQTQNESPL